MEDVGRRGGRGRGGEDVGRREDVGGEGGREKEGRK